MHCIYKIICQTINHHTSRLLVITALLAMVACGGSGSNGTTVADQTPEAIGDAPSVPTGEPPTDPPDPTQIDFSPSFPISGEPTSSLSGAPVIDLTLNYPASGVPAGNLMVISVYAEAPNSLSPGKLVSRRIFITRGETNYRTALYPDVFSLPTAANGDITLLVDVVVFSNIQGADAQLEFAAVPRSRVAFSAQEENGNRVYERIAFEKSLEPIMLALTPSATSYVQTLPTEDDSSTITIEHGSFFNTTLYLLINYDDACENDVFEVQLQVSTSDLASRVIPNSVRRTSEERCGFAASRLLTVSLAGMTDRLADSNNSVFDDVELQGIGTFKPAPNTFDSPRTFGTQPFCAANPGCLAYAVANPDGIVNVTTLGNISFSSRYSLSSDGRTIYFEGGGQLLPPDSFATFSEDGRSLTLSFLGFVFVAQEDAYTDLAVTGSVNLPPLDADKHYHASVILFSESEGGIDILARALIDDFDADNNSFLIDYTAENTPASDPLSLQISAAVFEVSDQPDTPATLAFRSTHPGDMLQFFDANSAQDVFESQVQTQLTVASFSGAASQLAAEVFEQNSAGNSERIVGLQFASIYDNYLHLVLEEQSSCQVPGGRFQLFYQPANDVPEAGLPSQWLGGDEAPCANATDTQLSVDLSALIAARAALGEPTPQSLTIARYGDYKPVLTPFSSRRVYANPAGCFVQENCETSLDFRADGTLYYQRSTILGTATYGISLDGRTIFSDGIPLSPEDTTAFLAEDGMSMTTRFTGTLFREL